MEFTILEKTDYSKKIQKIEAESYELKIEVVQKDPDERFLLMRLKESGNYEYGFIGNCMCCRASLISYPKMSWVGSCPDGCNGCIEKEKQLNSLCRSIKFDYSMEIDQNHSYLETEYSGGMTVVSWSNTHKIKMSPTFISIDSDGGKSWMTFLLYKELNDFDKEQTLFHKYWANKKRFLC